MLDTALNGSVFHLWYTHKELERNVWSKGNWSSVFLACLDLLEKRVIFVYRGFPQSVKIPGQGHGNNYKNDDNNEE